MKKLWRATGNTAFWLAWPLLFWYLHGSHRTRVLIVCGNEVLVLKNWLGAGKWMLPGGGVRRGETSKSAAVREVKEELGITLRATQLQLLSSSQYRQNGLRFEYDAYYAQLPEKLPFKVQFGEIADAAWIDLQMVTKEHCGNDLLSAVAAWSKSTKLLK